MAIATAVQKGSAVYIYDERGRVLFTVPFLNSPGMGLTGYTSSTVSIKRSGNAVYTYNEKGQCISVISSK